MYIRKQKIYHEQSYRAIPVYPECALAVNIRDIAGNWLNQTGKRILPDFSNANSFNVNFLLGLEPVSIPYTESFELDDLALLTAWTFSVTGTGSVSTTTADGPQSDGRHLKFDHPAQAGTESAILAIERLADMTGQILSFQLKRGNLGTSSTVQLAYSLDGMNWSTISSNIRPSAVDTYQLFSYNLGNILPAGGVGEVFFLRFQHTGGVSDAFDVWMDDLRISASNYAPTLTSVALLTGAEVFQPYTITYAMLASAANEMDVNGDPISFLVEAVSTGTLTKNGIAVSPGSTFLSPNEELVWTPDVSSSSSVGVTAFTVRAWDGALLSAAPVQVNVGVRVPNRAPTLTTIQTLNGAYEDLPFTIFYSTLKDAANEADIDNDPVSFLIESVSSGTLTINGNPIISGETILSNGVSIKWTGAPNANGSGINAFSVRAWDGRLLSATPVQVKVNVTSVNDAPSLTTVGTIFGATERKAFTLTHAALSGLADELDVEGSAVSFRVESVLTGTLTMNGVAVVPRANAY